MTIFVLDCGIGNVGAVRSMYRRLGHHAEIINRSRELASGDRLILPGIGAFDAGAAALADRQLVPFITEAAESGVPILGICLGMQLLCRGSEEGKMPGLQLIPADVRRLDPGPIGARIPHMGWNVVKTIRENPLLPAGQEEEQRFYFTHTFAVMNESDDYVVGVTKYSSGFASAVRRGNVFGVQFHPEKSHRFGKALLERFARWRPQRQDEGQYRTTEVRQ